MKQDPLLAPCECQVRTAFLVLVSAGDPTQSSMQARKALFLLQPTWLVGYLFRNGVSPNSPACSETSCVDQLKLRDLSAFFKLLLVEGSIAHVQRLEDTFVESVLSSHLHVVSGIWTQVTRLKCIFMLGHPFTWFMNLSKSCH